MNQCENYHVVRYAGDAFLGGPTVDLQERQGV